MDHNLSVNNFMRLLLTILGSLLIAPQALALTVPPKPGVLTPYVQAVVDYVDDALANVGGSTGTCDSTYSKAEAARELRSLLFDMDAAVVQPNFDIEQTVCLRNDVQALERYMRDLIDLMLASAYSCDAGSKAYYQEMIQYVWNMTVNLRRYGTDPRTQVPVSDKYVEKPPSDAKDSDDDKLCPYHSLYAPPSVDDVGCQDDALPITAPAQLQTEMLFVNSILKRMGILGVGGTALEFDNLRNSIARIWQDTDQYVWDVSNRVPGANIGIGPLTFTPVTIPNSGESGCLGWPSDVVSGSVTGENIPLREDYPFVLTNELAEVFEFLEEREHVRWFEYVQGLEDEIILDAAYVPSLYPNALSGINREHLGVESLSILSMRDPQSRMAKLANNLHEQTRELAMHVVSLDSSEGANAPLRIFTRNYAAFLSRICINRGCGNPLLRAVEHTLRDECFSAFLMDSFFQNNPNASTLPECRAMYTD